MLHTRIKSFLQTILDDMIKMKSRWCCHRMRLKELIASHHILCHHIISYPIPSYSLWSHSILSYPILFLVILFYSILSHSVEHITNHVSHPTLLTISPWTHTTRNATFNRSTLHHTTLHYTTLPYTTLHRTTDLFDLFSDINVLIKDFMR